MVSITVKIRMTGNVNGLGQGREGIRLQQRGGLVGPCSDLKLSLDLLRSTASYEQQTDSSGITTALSGGSVVPQHDCLSAHNETPPQ